MHDFGKQRATGSLVLVAVLLLNGAAGAEPSSEPVVEIRWSPVTSCPSEGWFVRRVEAFLGQSREAAATRDLRARVEVHDDADGFTAELEWEDSDGREQRALSDPDCLVLADASAFVVASAIDPLVSYDRATPLSEVAVSPEPSGPAIHEPERVPARAPEPQSVAVRRPGARAAESARYAFGPIVAGHLGLLPELALHFGGNAEVTSGRWRGALSISASAPREGELSSTARARYFALVSAVEGCWLLLLDPVEVPTCVVVEGALVRGRGEHVSDPRTSWLPFLGVGVGSGVALPVSDAVAVRLSAHVEGVAVRPRFLFNGQPISEPAAWAAAAALSLQWRFR